MKRSIVLLAGVLCCCLPAGAADADRRIVPGERIGKIAVGMEHAEVLRLLGAPAREDDLEYLATGSQKEKFKDILRDDWVTPIPIHENPKFAVNFFTVYVRDRRVVQIEVRDSRYKTKDHLSSASTAREWQKQYPHFTAAFVHFTHTSAGGWPAVKHNITFEDAIEPGVAWHYGAMGDLAPDTDPAMNLEAVTVHAPKTPMIVDPDGGSRFIWKDAPRRLSTER